ncbi:MAG: beta galactosidase jelly roll domain-containing protein, partial [Armatimonadetes bacterium]|nr:beta galactosidase jelly roll domain-containing protein [Armatimonadota bacterium]
MSTKLSKWIGALGLAALIALSPGSAQAEVLGQYFTFPGGPGSNPNRDDLYKCSNFFVSRIDNNIDFGWGEGSPGSGLPVNNFGVRWTGKIKFPKAGAWKLWISGDDGVRLWVSDSPIDPANPGTPLIQDWGLHGEREAPPAGDIPANDQPPVITTAADNEERFFMYEHYEQGGGAGARLRWEGPGTAKQIIPKANLIAATAPTGTQAAPGTVTGTATGPHTARASLTEAAGAGCYDLRVSIFPITPENFGSATMLPLDEGSTERLLEGLMPVQTYYFAARAIRSDLVASAPTFATVITTNPPPAPTTIAAGQEGITGYYYGYIPRKNAPDRLLEAFAPVNFMFNRKDDKIDFNWGEGRPSDDLNDPNVPVDGFAVRWVGRLSPAADGTYHFNFRTDDGARLWLSEEPIDINNPGTPIINDWIDRGPTNSISQGVPLKKGTSYYLLAEFYENGGGAYASLRYATDPATLGEDTTVIPAADLKTGEPLPASIFAGPARVNGRLVDAANTDNGVCCAEAYLEIGDGRSSAGVNGEGYFTLPARAAEGTLSVRSTLLNTERAIPSITVTPEANKVSNPTLQATSTSLTASEHKLTKDNSTWKYFKRSGPLVPAGALEPTLFNPNWILPSFDDSGPEWRVQPDPDTTTGVDPGLPRSGSYVIRGHFTIPDGLNIDNGAQIRNHSVDGRAYSAWVNGWPIGHSWTANGQGNRLIPKGVLKKGQDNVIVYFVNNLSGVLGMIDPPYITPVSSQNGHLQVHVTGANAPHIPELADYGNNWYGVGNGITLGAFDEDDTLIATAGPTTMNGIADFYNLPAGTYTIRVMGSPRLADRWMETRGVVITAGEVRTAELVSNPARSLNNTWLDETKAEGPWWAKPNIEEAPNSSSPPDATPFLDPALNPSRETGWYPLVEFPSDLNADRADKGLEMPDPADPTKKVAVFGSNQWSVARVDISLPEAMNQTVNGQKVDLWMDDVNWDDYDVTYFNGVEIGRQGPWDSERNYRIPRSGESAVPVKFGDGEANKNIITVLWWNGTGGTGPSQRDRTFRIRMATMEALFEPYKPFGVTATGGNNQAVITFSPSMGATSYDVFRATSANGPFTKVNTQPVTTTTYTDTTAVNGTEYFYVVRAVNTAGSSDQSRVVTVTPVAPPP